MRMRSEIMSLNMLHVDSLSYTRHLIYISDEVADVWIVDNPCAVCLEVYNIHLGKGFDINCECSRILTLKYLVKSD